jgi:hypothetical protein
MRSRLREFLMSVGRAQEAVEMYRRAQRTRCRLGYQVTFSSISIPGRREEAEAEFERSKHLAGESRRWEWAAMLRLWSHPGADPAIVRSRFQAIIGLYASPLDRALGECLDAPEVAGVVLHKAFDDPACQNASAMTVIFLYADHFQDKELALAALRRAILVSQKTNLEGLWWPVETNLRTDPRFKELVREIGLVDYWRTTGKWGDFARPLGERDFEVFR